ncbi:1-deoxy-D-xylulose-5-phosphate reductoisomerase [Spartinivicinus sp. A2-2]|uniref:1-deoxy-D-xylulose 5-phosphate reductoisomerase n=1 Tax=Spartinivicinus poritis TaxID=2994640 RepID=A0ABT5U5C8_9GAMM|nr:1-deoxy-D-xylulose-5-phosphate reductoisomerase [Spartinivicinus sp. A2-2]MDE1460394.1 1-deoxy-D-xylulose-5-phosphate reductoisomerase [Spartinivicinus sp. A2-2]
MQQITILGSTGSIGCSTLAVIKAHSDKYQVFALAANQQVEKLFQQCMQFAPKYAVLVNEAAADQLAERLRSAGSSTEVLAGKAALAAVAEDPQVDVVMAAIMGAAGLLPTLAAVKTGKKVLLANKESLVMAGELFMNAVKVHKATLLPIDSEHNAIFQCLPHCFQSLPDAGVRRVVLTASGGPFRKFSQAQLTEVTPEQACAHPNWSMGQKISVDSASMMNKGLELIEACHLFAIKPEWVDVVIHPQSIIHSMVDYIDGSVLAQMGNPDMCTPIAHALAWPARMSTEVKPLNLADIAQLDFYPPDEQRFPCLKLAREAAEAGGTAPAILNAANEVAVAAFLAGTIRFIDIPLINETVLTRLEVQPSFELENVLVADGKARELAMTLINQVGL